jgi:hypothetical protein
MSESHAALDVLRSIDASLKALVVFATARASKTSGKPVASDADLDGKHGDPIVKFDPRDWSGNSCKGLPMSACPPEFLDLLAETFDYFASEAERKNELWNDKPVAPYKRADAARARGWAKRIREGRAPAKTAPGAFGGHSDDF